MAKIEDEPKAAHYEKWAAKEIRKCRERNRDLLARVVDLTIENACMRRQLELLASLGIDIERETRQDED